MHVDGLLHLSDRLFFKQLFPLFHKLFTQLLEHG